MTIPKTHSTHSLRKSVNPHLGTMTPKKSRPWDKSPYTEYYDLMKKAKDLGNELLQYRDKSTLGTSNPL